MVRDKLNEHIIYLQNEIRKRDELLEGGSDFGGDDDFAAESDSLADETSSKGDAIRSSATKNGEEDPSKLTDTPKQSFAKSQRPGKGRTLNQILRQQLEDSRNQLKGQIE